MRTTIVTSYVVAAYSLGPWPAERNWTAVRSDYDEGGLIGHGRTEEAAKADLIEQEND